MCFGCVEEHGGLTESTDEMVELSRLVWDWYRLEGNDVGGPLHIVTDDFNIEDQHLEFCRGALLGLDPEAARWHDQHRTPERDELGGRILDGLGALTERQRVTVMWRADPYGQRPD